MKKTVPFLIALCLLLCGCGAEEKNDTGKLVLDPTECTEATVATEVPEGQEAVTEPTEAAQTQTVTRQTRMASLDENGAELWSRTYEYDSQGRLCGEREVDSTGAETYSAVITYDEEGRTTTYTQSDGSGYSIQDQLDENGNVLFSQTFRNGHDEGYTEYTYDQYGNQLSYRSVSGRDEMTFTYEYTYTAAGDVLTRREYMDGELIGWLEAEYDETGRCTDSVYYNADGTVSSSTHCTWEGSTETRTYFDEADEAYMIVIITYDAEGNVLRRESQQDGVVINCSEYTYESIEITAP